MAVIMHFFWPLSQDRVEFLARRQLRPVPAGPRSSPAEGKFQWPPRRAGACTGTPARAAATRDQRPEETSRVVAET